MSILRYLSSALLKKIKGSRISDTSNILGGASTNANSEPEQNYVDSYYHS